MLGSGKFERPIEYEKLISALPIRTLARHLFFRKIEESSQLGSVIVVLKVARD